MVGCAPEIKNRLFARLIERSLSKNTTLFRSILLECDNRRTMSITRYTEPEWSRSALMTVDVQRDFTLPGAPAEIPGTMEVVPQVADLLEAYRASGAPIIHMVRFYRSDGSNVDLCRRGAIQRGEQIVRPGTDGAQLSRSIKEH